MSARRATPEARCVWLDEDDHIALRYILKGNPGGADLKDWAMSMCERYHAAPADPVEAVAEALARVIPEITHESAFQQVEIVLDAIRDALGEPPEALGYPDGSPRQETPT